MNGNETVAIPELTYFEEIMRHGFLGNYLSTHPGFGSAAEIIVWMVLGFLVCAVTAYVIGSLNVGIILSRKVYKQDIRELGSKNAGATNMARVFGGKAGVLTILGEFVKTFVAVYIGRLIWVVEGMFVSGLFAVLGQIFPVFYRFRGGKGVAATAAVMLFTTPGTFLVELVIFVIVAGGTKFISLASLMAAVLYPVLLNTITGPGLHNIVAILIAILICYRHKDNIKRLWNKEERKFEFGKVFKTKRRKKKEEEAAKAAAEAEAEAITDDKNGEKK